MKDRKDGKMRNKTNAVTIRPYGKWKTLEFKNH